MLTECCNNISIFSDACLPCGLIHVPQAKEVNSEIRVAVGGHLAVALHSALLPSETINMFCSRCKHNTDHSESVGFKTLPNVLVLLIDR